jgi:hypothetical protein
MMQRTLLTSAVVLLAARSHPSIPLRRVGIQRRSSTISPTTSRYWSETPPRNRDWQDFASCSARTSMFPASAALLSADIGGLSPVTATGVPRAVRELRRGHYSDRLSEFADSGDLLRATGNQAAQDRAIVSSEINPRGGTQPERSADQRRLAPDRRQRHLQDQRRCHRRAQHGGERPRRARIGSRAQWRAGAVYSCGFKTADRKLCSSLAKASSTCWPSDRRTR